MTLLTAALLVAPVAAWAGYYAEGQCYVPAHYTYGYCGVCRQSAPYVDTRVKIAEAEKLKADLHYYSLSSKPIDKTTAGWVASELNSLNADIDAVYSGR
jgi:hypothetical protein